MTSIRHDANKKVQPKLTNTPSQESGDKFSPNSATRLYPVTTSQPHHTKHARTPKTSTTGLLSTGHAFDRPTAPWVRDAPGHCPTTDTVTGNYRLPNQTKPNRTEPGHYYYTLARLAQWPRRDFDTANGTDGRGKQRQFPDFGGRSPDDGRRRCRHVRKGAPLLRHRTVEIARARSETGPGSRCISAARGARGRPS